MVVRSGNVFFAFAKVDVILLRFEARSINPEIKFVESGEYRDPDGTSLMGIKLFTCTQLISTMKTYVNISIICFQYVQSN